MKRAILFLVLVIAGCGDTVNNTYTTQGSGPSTTTTTTTTTTPLTLPDPPVLAGDAPFIPSNTYCTEKMNEQYAISGASQDMTSTNNYTYDIYSHVWRYPSKGIDLRFDWGKGTGSALCNFYTNTYTLNTTGTTIFPPTPVTPPPTVEGAALFIPSNTYCTTDMNTVYQSYGEPPSYYSTTSTGYGSLTMRYSSLGKSYGFTWFDSSAGCQKSVDSFNPY